MTEIVAVQAIVLVLALSLDAFVASFSYGVDKIKIPLFSAIIISIITSAFLAISLGIGIGFSHLIPARVATAVAASVLIVLGSIKLFGSLIKRHIKKKQKGSEGIKFKFFSFSVVLQVIAEPTKADRDGSKVLSVSEAAILAVALSLDSIAGGLGAGLARGTFFFTILASLALGVLLIVLGSIVGNAVRKKTRVNLSFVSGVILIALGVLKIFI